MPNYSGNEPYPTIGPTGGRPFFGGHCWSRVASFRRLRTIRLLWKAYFFFFREIDQSNYLFSSFCEWLRYFYLSLSFLHFFFSLLIILDRSVINVIFLNSMEKIIFRYLNDDLIVLFFLVWLFARKNVIIKTSWKFRSERKNEPRCWDWTLFFKFCEHLCLK